MTEKYIVKHSRLISKIDQVGGVYFLINHGVVVYVGSSRNPLGRIRNHIREAKKTTLKFTRFFLLPLEGDPDEIRLVEDFYIKRFKPKYNRNGASQFTPLKEWW